MLDNNKIEIVRPVESLIVPEDATVQDQAILVDGLGAKDAYSEQDQVASRLVTRRRGLSFWRKAGISALAVIAGQGFGGIISKHGDPAPLPSPAHTQEISLDVNPQAANEFVVKNNNKIDKEITKESVEQKYGINLITMKEAFALMGRQYDEQNPELVGQAPPVRWSKEQIMLLDDLFQYLPKNLYEAHNGKRLELFIGDFGTDCSCAGVSYGDSGVVGAMTAAINPGDREGAFSLLTHEFTHRLDYLTGNKLQGEIMAIFGDAFSKDPDGFIAEFTAMDKEDLDRGSAISTVKQMYEGEFTEPIANISQFYVRGHDRFMNALGPLLEGNGYRELGYPEATSMPTPSDASLGDSSSPTPTVEDLAVLYPKTQALYELYKSEVFQGKEYSAYDIDVINLGLENKLKADEQAEKKLHGINTTDSNEVNYPDASEIKQTKQSEQVELVMKELEAKFGISFISETQRQLTLDEVKLIGRILELTPQDIYPKEGQDKLNVVLAEYMAEIPKGNYTLVYVDSLHNAGGVVEGTKVLDAAVNFMGDLGEIKDKLDGNKTQNEIISILGGEKFLQSPAQEYPNLIKLNNLHTQDINELIYDFNNNGDRVFYDLSRMYIGGWENFSKVAQIINPEISKEDLLSMNVDNSETKVAQLYRLYKKLYGVEFTGKVDDQGIPEIIPVVLS